MTTVKPDCTLLISSAGRRVELLRCFRDSAAALGIELRVIAVDMDPTMSAACQLADEALGVPSGEDPEFVPALLGICERHRVDLVIPTIDLELDRLGPEAPRFAAIGAYVSVAQPEVVRIARDKLQTARFLKSAGLPAPRSARLDEVAADPAAWSWPLLIKPRGGWSSIGIRVLSSPEALAELEPSRDLVAQELLRGEEYTVNLFFDRSGRMRCAIPHLRCEVRAGEVAKGITRRHERLEAIAWTMGEAISGARGVLCFQAIVDDAGRPAVFEINARFGGGYPLAHQAGARFTDWLLEEALGRPPRADNAWQDGVLMLRYDQSVFREAAAR